MLPFGRRFLFLTTRSADTATDIIISFGARTPITSDAMYGENQAFINLDGYPSICLTCNGLMTESTEIMLAHCRSETHLDQWCERCLWLFTSSAARAEHVSTAACHWICEFCPHDACDQVELTAHEESQHQFCRSCNVFFRDFVQHRQQGHLRCKHCSKEFLVRGALVRVRGYQPNMQVLTLPSTK